MLQGRELGTSPFVCTHWTQVAGTVRKLVHKKRILVHFYVEAGTVYKSSAHHVTLKTEVILSLLHDARIQNSGTKFRDKILTLQQNIFRKNEHVTEGNLWLQHVP